MTQSKDLRSSKILCQLIFYMPREALMRHYQVLLVQFNMTKQQWHILPENTPLEMVELATQACI